MPWFYVDDGFSDSKPVMRLDRALRNEAVGLWLRCGAWSAKEETDGHVPLEIVRHFGGTPRVIRALHTQAELWDCPDQILVRISPKTRPESDPKPDQNLTQILFRNWSKWQRTHAELAEKRRADAERQRQSRARKGRNAVSSENAARTEDSVNPSADADTHPPADADTEMSQCDSRVTSRARAQTRPDPTPSKDLGRGCPVGEPDGLPPRFCEEHPNGTSRGCGNCREARLRREAAEAVAARDELDAKRRRRDAAVNCPTCQGSNWIPDTDPAIRCTHQGVIHA